MNPLLTDFKDTAERTLNLLREEVKGIRTGRATTALVEDMLIEAYGGEAKLRMSEVASLTTEGPLTLTIVPFDPSVTGDIERAILKSTLGLTPSVQGNKIIIKIPPMSEEQRNKFVRLVSDMIEEKKETLRLARDEARKKIKARFEDKEISEDEKFRFERELDREAGSYMEKVQEIKQRKEQEIREV